MTATITTDKKPSTFKKFTNKVFYGCETEYNEPDVKVKEGEVVFENDTDNQDHREKKFNIHIDKEKIKSGAIEAGFIASSGLILGCIITNPVLACSILIHDYTKSKLFEKK